MSPSADPFKGIVLSTSSTIRNTMEAITANAHEMVLIRDADQRIVGLITDGDIRRGLLRGLNLDSDATEVMTRDFVSVSDDPGRAAVLDLIRARTIRHIPVLDAKRRLLAINFLRDLIGASPKANVAVVMAGGRGTRLRPLTEHMPKPMLRLRAALFSKHRLASCQPWRIAHLSCREFQGRDHRTAFRRWDKIRLPD